MADSRGMTNNIGAIRIAPIVHEHHRRPRRRLLVALSVLTVSAVALAACGSSSSTSEPSSVTVTTVVPTTFATTTPSTTVAPNGPYRSALYGYVVTSLDWTGRSATIAWDGTGSPGDGDPTVDALIGPQGHPVYGMAAPTTATLDEAVASARAAAHASPYHPCPAAPEVTRPTTISGEPAILDEIHCPDPAGVFALSATVIHAGMVYAFFTFDQPGKEAEMRIWFASLLQTISFDV